MNVRKFFASSSRQALYLVRESMGPDALILSNHQVEGGVEILAMAQADMPPLAATTHVHRGKAADPPGHATGGVPYCGRRRSRHCSSRRGDEHPR